MTRHRHGGDVEPTGTIDALLARLRVNARGLSAAEAEERFRTDGPNTPAHRTLRTKVAKVVRSILNPLVVILVVAGTASAFLGEGINAAIIGGIVLLSAGLNGWQTLRSAVSGRRPYCGTAAGSTCHAVTSSRATSSGSRPATWSRRTGG